MSALVEMSSGANQARGSIKIERRLPTLGRERSCFQQDGHQSDDAMPTHGTIALVVHEQHTDIGLRSDWGCNDAAIHVVMAAWLPHQRSAYVVEVLVHVLPPLQYRRSTRFGQPSGDDAQWLPCCVCIDGSNDHGILRQRMLIPVQLHLFLFSLIIYANLGSMISQTLP